MKTGSAIREPAPRHPVDFSAAKEMRPYLEEPTAMPVGTPGKSGYLYLGFEIDDEGRCVMRDLDRRAPLIVQQELYFDEGMPEMPCVYILSSGGPNVDGDRYMQHFVIRRDAYAHISTGAATKLAEMRCNYSGLRQQIVLEQNAYLEYLPEPVIPCRHTRYICDTNIVVDPTATLFYSEIYMGGRKYFGGGESFLYDVLSVCTHARRADGEELFREKFVVRPREQPVRTVGVMEGYEVFANAIVLTPKEHADRIYDAIPACIDREQRIAAGITRLPNDCGLLYRVLGDETEPVKRLVRQLCSAVRMQVKGRELPGEFPWR